MAIKISNIKIAKTQDLRYGLYSKAKKYQEAELIDYLRNILHGKGFVADFKII